MRMAGTECWSLGTHIIISKHVYSLSENGDHVGYHDALFTRRTHTHARFLHPFFWEMKRSSSMQLMIYRKEIVADVEKHQEAEPQRIKERRA